MTSRRRSPLATRVSTRTLLVLALVLLVSAVAAAALGLFLIRQPPLEPNPVPSVSQI